jgi:hypothetical protein
MRRPGVRLSNSVGHQVARSAISHRTQRRNDLATFLSISNSVGGTVPATTALRTNFASWTGSMIAGSKCGPKAGRTGFRQCATLKWPSAIVGTTS